MCSVRVTRRVHGRGWEQRSHQQTFAGRPSGHVRQSRPSSQPGAIGGGAVGSHGHVGRAAAFGAIGPLGSLGSLSPIQQRGQGGGGFERNFQKNIQRNFQRRVGRGGGGKCGTQVAERPGQSEPWASGEHHKYQHRYRRVVVVRLRAAGAGGVVAKNTEPTNQLPLVGDEVS